MADYVYLWTDADLEFLIHYRSNRREADDSRVEQVGALRNRGLATPLIAVE